MAAHCRGRLPLAKVCGTLDFGDDLKLKMPPGTLHLAVVQPKLAHHANIIKIDYTEAEKDARCRQNTNCKRCPRD